MPLKMYFQRGRVKVEVAVAKGKKLYDKRDTMAEQDAQREIARAMRERNRGSYDE